MSIHTRQCPFQARRVPLANTGSGVRRRHRVQRAQQSGQPRAGSIFLESPTIEFQRNRVRPLHSPTYDPHPSNVLHSSESRHTCAKMIERTFVSRTCAKVRLPPCFLVLQFWVNDRLTYTQGGCYSPECRCCHLAQYSRLLGPALIQWVASPLNQRHSFLTRMPG